MKPLALGLLAVLALTLLACGGGSNVVVPPPAGNFGPASLSGQYVFSLSGVNLAGAYVAHIGSFTADGTGHITTGLEDVLTLGSGPAAILPLTGGTYQIQSDGRGTMILQVSGGGTLSMSLTMQSTSTGFLIQTADDSADLTASSSGRFYVQNPLNFTTSALVNHYVLESSGIAFGHSSVSIVSLAGQLTLDGNGTVTGGVMDSNNGNIKTPSGATPVSSGAYQLDTSGNGTAFGRGTITFNGYTFAFYIIDSTHLKILEEDALGGSSGEAFLQNGTIPMQNSGFAGSFVYLISAASFLGSQGPVARVARFTADGNGGLSSISLDDNNDGRYSHLSQGSNITNATYAIDTSNSGSGRGTFTFTDSGLGTFSDVFYIVSPAQAVVLETSRGIIGNGPMYPQTGSPFTVGSSTGKYVFNWNGVQLGASTAVPFKEDFTGQFALSKATTSNIAGALDYVEFGLSSDNLFSNIGLGGTLTINGDGTMNNHYQFALGGSSSTTINFQAYFVNPDTVLLVCSDGNRTTSGILRPQM